MLAVAVGVVEVGSAVGDPVVGFPVPSADAEGLAESLGDFGADGTAASDERAVDVPSEGRVDAESPAAGLVRSRLPSASPDDDPEKANPAISAAADAAPAAPATTAILRDRQALGLRRPPGLRWALRPEAALSPPATGGSSAVSSYAFCQPCAIAGSVYSS